jgi:hypothetical protein
VSPQTQVFAVSWLVGPKDRMDGTLMGNLQHTGKECRVLFLLIELKLSIKLLLSLTSLHFLAWNLI